MKLHCRRYTSVEGPTTGPPGPTVAPPATGTAPPPRAAVVVDKLQVCGEGQCHNGGTCRRVQPADSAVPPCDCPLHFTGRFCEKGRPLGFYSTRREFPLPLPTQTAFGNYSFFEWVWGSGDGLKVRALDRAGYSLAVGGAWLARWNDLGPDTKCPQSSCRPPGARCLTPTWHH